MKVKSFIHWHSGVKVPVARMLSQHGWQIIDVQFTRHNPPLPCGTRRQLHADLFFGGTLELFGS
jgi:hypothetical protein